MPNGRTRTRWAVKLIDPRKFHELVKTGGHEAVESVRKQVTLEVVREEGKKLRIAISSEAVDRDNDIISLGGWKLDAFRANPVVLWMHDRYEPPVATSTREWIEGAKLWSEPEFTPRDMNPFGHMIGEMLRAAFLGAASVGFKPITYVFNEARGGVDFSTQELREYSIVTIPANPDATVSRAKASGIDVSPYVEWCERILEETRGKGFWVTRETVEATWKAAAPEKTIVVPTPAPAPALTKAEPPPAPEVKPEPEKAPAGPTLEELSKLIDSRLAARNSELRTALTGRLD
jgi:HK97 family phage prohead protease